MELEFTTQADRDMDGLGHGERVRVMDKLSLFAAAPDAFRNQVKKLQGTENWRFRIGNYRVIYRGDGSILRVLRVLHRREAYR